MAYDSKLAWIYTRAPRAAAISNDHIDLYKERIRQLYLVQNLSRAEVTCHLQRTYGFSVSPDQFSRATNRWGFHKQSRTQRGTTASSTDTATLDGQSHASDTPSSTTVTTPAEPGKRPRSTGSTGYEASGEAGSGSQKGPSVAPERLAKRCKPTRDSSGSLHIEPIQDDTSLESSDDELENEAPPEDSVKKPLPKADSSASSHDSDPETDELCAEFLASCYFFKKSFAFFEKIAIPLEGKKCSGRERRARMLDLARTAKSSRTRKVACTFLESELKVNGDARGHAFIQNSLDEDSITPNEAFLFHRHLARMYSYQHSHAPDVHYHLDKAREFIFGEPSLDLWTLHQLVDGKEGLPIPDDLLNAFRFEKTDLIFGIPLCLGWCKKRLLELEPKEWMHEIPEPQIEVDPTSMSHWRLQWDPLAFWAHTSSLFARLWRDWQIRSLSEDDTLTWVLKDLLPGISTTHVLMIICRMIVDESRFFTPPWRSRGHIEGKHDVLEDLYKVKIRPCLQAMDSLISKCGSSPAKVRSQFVHHFCNHHSWTPPSRSKNEVMQRIQRELLECLETTIKASSHRQIVTPIPLILHNPTPEPDRQDSDVASLSEFLNSSALEEKKKSGTLEAFGSNMSQLDPVWRCSSSTASRSTISLQARRLYLSVLQGNPPLTRSRASQSSYCSQVSQTSSLQRFKAAGSRLQNASSTATDPRSSGYSGNELQPEWDGDALLS